MKKVKLLLGIFCLALMSACCCNGNKNADCQVEEKKDCAIKCEMNEEQKAFFEKWQNFDTFSAEEQKELIEKRKSCIEQCEADKKAAIEEFEAKWANFDNLTIAEQKELLEQKEACLKASCYKNSKCCKVLQQKQCNKDEKEKCSKVEE
jgi:hypothetical protein